MDTESGVTEIIKAIDDLCQTLGLQKLEVSCEKTMPVICTLRVNNKIFTTDAISKDHAVFKAYLLALQDLEELALVNKNNENKEMEGVGKTNSQDEKIPKRDNCRDEGITSDNEQCDDLGDAENYEHGGLKSWKLNINKVEDKKQDEKQEKKKLKKRRVTLSRSNVEAIGFQHELHKKPSNNPIQTRQKYCPTESPVFCELCHVAIDENEHVFIKNNNVVFKGKDEPPSNIKYDRSYANIPETVFLDEEEKTACVPCSLNHQLNHD